MAEYDGQVVIQITADSDKFESALNGLDTNMKGLSTSGSNMATTLATAFGHVLADAVELVAQKVVELGQNVYEASVSFESAFAGVKKTVDETADISYEDLEQSIRDMAKEVPATVEEISAVAEAAGQLGISTEGIMDFSRVMIDLGNSTNVCAEEAASLLAQFANVTKLDESEYSNLGAAITDLGNNFATTESDIINMSQRMAATATSAGISEQEILALATAVSSVGIEAEAGGTAMSSFIKKIQTAVETQSDKLATYAEVAGLTEEEFSALFKSDGASAISAFVSGLGDLDENGGSALNTLSDLGMTEVRLSNMVLALANSEDILNNALETSASAWEAGTALEEEANKRYETTASQVEMLKNQLNDLYISIGDSLSTGMSIDFLGDYIERLNEAVTEGGIEGLIEELGNVIQDALADTVTAISEFLDNNGATIIQWIMDLVVTLIDSITEQFPTVVSAVMNIIQTLVDTLYEHSEDITQAAIDIIVILGNGLAENVSSIIPKIVTMLTDIALVILDNIDEIACVAVDIVAAIAQGLIEAVVDTAVRAPEIVASIIAALVLSVPKTIYEIAEAFGTAIVNGFLSLDWSEIETEGQKINEIWKNLTRNLLDFMTDGTATAERTVTDYSSYSKEQIESMISTTSKKLGELNNLAIEWQENNDYNALPQWVRTAAENSGKSIEEYLSESITSLENTYADLNAALPNATSEAYLAGVEKIEQEKQAYEDTLARLKQEIADGLHGVQEEAEDTSTTNTSEDEDISLEDRLAELEKLYNIHQLTEEQYWAKRKSVLEQYRDDESEDWWGYYDEVTEYYEKLEETEKEAMEEASKTIYDTAVSNAKNELANIKSNLNDLVDTYKTQYDSIISLRDSYKSKLMGDSIFSVTTETDAETGEEKTTYTIENLTEQLNKQKKYAEQISKLEQRGLASGLMSELESLDTDQAMIFAEQLNKMSDSEFNELNDAYNELDETTTALANNRYADELETLQTSFISQAQALFDNMSDDLSVAGLNSVSAFISSFDLTKNSTAFEDLTAFSESVIDTITDSLDSGNTDISEHINGIIGDSNAGDTLVQSILDSITTNKDELTSAIQAIFDSTGIDMQIRADAENEAAKISEKGYTEANNYVAEQPQTTQTSTTTSGSNDVTVNANLQLTADGKRVLAEIVNSENEQIQIQSGR